MIRAVPTVAAMASYALADLGDTAAVSLAQNESAFPPSPRALNAAQEALQATPLYPDPDWHALRAALADTHPVAPGQILCGAGSMELIGCLIRAFAGPGDEVLGTAYGYLFVATAAQQAGARYVQAPEPDLRVDVDAILTAVTPATKIVFLCNPGNPTGTCIPNTDILRLRNTLPRDVLLVVDQAYGEFDLQDPAALFALVARGDTVVTRTLSKAYGLAGARVGWGAFPPTISNEVRKLMNPNNISTVTQAMATAAIRDQAHMHNNVTQTAKIRDAFCTRLRIAGLNVPESATNFALIQFADTASAQAADTALRHNGLILRGMSGYGLPDCLRATIGAADIMDRVATVLEHTHG